MILTNCANCHAMIRLVPGAAAPWVDDEGGVRCPVESIAGSTQQHHVTGKALILQIVSDEMHRVDRERHNTATPQDYMEAVAEAMHERLGDGQNGRHH